jgi:hypothetical protein
MIQWQPVIFNSLWIFGMAIILAGLSFQYWQARSDGLSLKDELAKPPFLASLWLGLVCVGAGLAGTSSRPWELVLWSVLAFFSLVNLVNASRVSRSGLDRGK